MAMIWRDRLHGSFILRSRQVLQRVCSGMSTRLSTRTSGRAERVRCEVLRGVNELYKLQRYSNTSEIHDMSPKNFKSW